MLAMRGRIRTESRRRDDDERNGASGQRRRRQSGGLHQHLATRNIKQRSSLTDLRFRARCDWPRFSTGTASSPFSPARWTTFPGFTRHAGILTLSEWPSRAISHSRSSVKPDVRVVVSIRLRETRNASPERSFAVMRFRGHSMKEQLERVRETREKNTRNESPRDG